MASSAASTPEITIDVTNDLESLSDLRQLISSNSNAILQLGSEFAQHAGAPVSSAAGSFAASLDLTASPSWKTASGISFSLKPDAKCNIAIAKSGESFPVALKVDSSGTTDVQLTPPGGMTYVNIDLDFDITGNVSGSGTVSGVGISGKASGSVTTTLSFCQPVPSSTETMLALRTALSQLVFPTAPDSALRMIPGSSCRMNFDGTLDCELDVSYGLGDYKLSAPSAALVEQSVAKAWQKLTLPTAEIKVGATGSVKYSHADHFGLIVEKPDAATALLYLVRSSQDEASESLGVSAGITTTNVSLAFDPTKIETTVQNLTGSATLASQIGAAVSQPVNNLETAATAKLNTWISDANGNVGLTFALSQQKGRTALFNFKVDLTQAALAQESWKALLEGSVANAMSIGGFTLLAGSGVAENIQRQSTLQLQFFNLFSWSDQQDFFQTSYTELAADGTIRIVSDIGVEDDVTTKKALDKMCFYFSATASEDTKADVSKAEIDLNLELSEQGDPKGALVLANVLGMIGSASLQPAIGQMTAYAAKNPKGTLGLVATLKPSAYGRLAFSPYSGGKPPADRHLDQTNWNAIHDATASLMNLVFAKPWQYSDWGTFNSYCNTGGPDATPDRHNSGNPAAVPSTFWGNYQDQAQFISYFFVASADGMNLFEDLVTLAKDIANVTTIDQWNAILKRVTSIVNGDANIDYAKPIAASVLSLAAKQGAQTSVSTAQAKDSSTFTTTLTIA
jgi:hypothetical protein